MHLLDMGFVSWTLHLTVLPMLHRIQLQQGNSAIFSPLVCYCICMQVWMLPALQWIAINILHMLSVKMFSYLFYGDVGVHYLNFYKRRM